jgi:hypothetical protein
MVKSILKNLFSTLNTYRANWADMLKKVTFEKGLPKLIENQGNAKTSLFNFTSRQREWEHYTDGVFFT